MAINNYGDSSVLSASLTQVQQLLGTWSDDVMSGGVLQYSVFGEEYDRTALELILSAWQNQDFSIIPPITILTPEQLNGAYGAFSTENNTIYLSSALLIDNNTNTLIRTILEEIGHKIDSVINTFDTSGDEGAIFASLVLGETLTESELALLKEENDHGVITLNGIDIVVEMATNTYILDIGNNFFEGTNLDD